MSITDFDRYVSIGWNSSTPLVGVSTKTQCFEDYDGGPRSGNKETFTSWVICYIEALATMAVTTFSRPSRRDRIAVSTISTWILCWTSIVHLHHVQTVKEIRREKISTCEPSSLATSITSRNARTRALGVSKYAVQVRVRWTQLEME